MEAHKASGSDPAAEHLPGWDGNLGMAQPLGPCRKGLFLLKLPVSLCFRGLDDEGEKEKEPEDGELVLNLINYSYTE